MINDYYTVPEVLRLFCIGSPRTLYQWLKKGKIKGKRIQPNKIVFEKDEIERFIRENRLDVSLS